MQTIRTTINGSGVEITSDLIERYDRPLPRYTSYPPAPAWTTDVDASDLISSLQHLKTSTLSLYIHLPFCRSRCTFCACHAIATTKTEIIDRYIDALIAEMDMVFKHRSPLTPTLSPGGRGMGEGDSSTIQCLHWGGGTPTYLSEGQIERLTNEIKKRFLFEENAEIGIEADPRQTTPEKVRLLHKAGFNRISFGIQDTNHEVLNACGKSLSRPLSRKGRGNFSIPAPLTRDGEDAGIEDLINESRLAGFESVNIDICYGLPKQSPKSFQKTLDDIIRLSPDRIALFNFAYVPWMQPHQRRIDPKTLPAPHAKLKMFANAIDQFSNAGYRFIGLDHFAKNRDELSRAFANRTLRRTFQGYTAKASDTLIGLGVTSISEFNDCFGGLYSQNERRLSDYFRKIGNGQLPACRGFVLSRDDMIRRDVMQRLFCRQKIDKADFEGAWRVSFDDYFHDIKLDDLEADGLIRKSKDELCVAPLGRLFIRNIASRFDRYLRPQETRYSRTV